MGAYYEVLNLDKREYLHPRSFGEGAKLVEFGSCGRGTMLALGLLIALPGKVDLAPYDVKYSGRWAGDLVVIVREGNTLDEKLGNGDGWTDISVPMLRLLLKDPDWASEIKEPWRLARMPDRVRRELGL